MQAEDAPADPAAQRLAAIERRALDGGAAAVLAAEDARFLLDAVRRLQAEASLLRDERDAAYRALLEGWPELPELGPAEVEDLLEQLGLVSDAPGTAERTLALTEKALGALGQPAEGTGATAAPIRDLVAICRALGLDTLLRSAEELQSLAEALLLAAAESAIWPAPAETRPSTETPPPP